MTIANILLRPDEVFLASDTLVTVDGMSFNLESKITLFPRVSAAMVFRGMASAENELKAHVAQTFVRDADELAGVVCGRLKGVPAEVVIAGWSPWAGRFRAWHAGPRTEWQDTELCDGLHGLPVQGPSWPVGRPVTGLPAEPASLVSMALQQRAWLEAEDPGVMHVGGEVEVAHLTRSGTEIVRAHRWGDTDEVEAHLVRRRRAVSLALQIAAARSVPEMVC